MLWYHLQHQRRLVVRRPCMRTQQRLTWLIQLTTTIRLTHRFERNFGRPLGFIVNTLVTILSLSLSFVHVRSCPGETFSEYPPPLSECPLQTLSVYNVKSHWELQRARGFTVCNFFSGILHLCVKSHRQTVRWGGGGILRVRERIRVRFRHYKHTEGAFRKRGSSENVTPVCRLE